MSPQIIRIELLAGLTAALSLVPEVVGFALLAHVNPLTGLYAAFILCLVAAIWGGRPGMISGAAGSMAVVSAGLVVQHGVEYLFAAVILTGLLQLVFAWARLGKIIRMVAALGHARLRQWPGHHHRLRAAPALPHSAAANGAEAWLPWPRLLTMLGLVAVTIAVTVLLPRLTQSLPLGPRRHPRRDRRAPSPSASTLAPSATSLPSTAPSRASTSPPLPYTFDTLRIILPYAFDSR